MGLMEKIRKLTKFQKICINFFASMIEAVLITVAFGLGSTPFRFELAGLLTSFIVLSQTLIITFRTMVAGKEVNDPYIE